MSWSCLGCETVNEDAQDRCVVCDRPHLYTRTQIDAELDAVRLRAQKDVESVRRIMQVEIDAVRRTATRVAAIEAVQPSLTSRPRPRIFGSVIFLVIGLVIGYLLVKEQPFFGPVILLVTGLVIGYLFVKEQPSAPSSKSMIRNSIGMEFVLIADGTCQIGSNNPGAGDDEKPVHQVQLSHAFYLGKYEVTQGQWQTVMGNNPSHFKGDADLPVEAVSWDDVQEFIRKLNAREHGVKYRLPTEAEWEYAARAGTTTAYSVSNATSQLEDYAWYGENAGGKTHPVGQKKANPWGLYDMHGNVWEWVQDWYGPYTVGTAVDPIGPASGVHRVFRGGSSLKDARNCRATCRNHVAPGDRYRDLGFRLLREVP